jgi:hypothetical protein
VTNPFKRCVHDWKVLHEVKVPSKAEILGTLPPGMKCGVFPMDMDAMCRVRVTTILSCAKCGALREVRTCN